MDLCLMGMEFGSIGRLSSKRYKLLNSMIIATPKRVCKFYFRQAPHRMK